MISFFKPFSFCDYDILHSHSFRPDLYTFLFRSKIFCRIITTVHNYVKEELYYTYSLTVSKIFSFIWVSTWRNKDSVVFLSHDMKSYYELNFGIVYNTKVIFNGRDVDTSFSITNNQIVTFVNGLKENYKILGSVGFLNKRKGFDDLIKMLTVNSNLFAIFIGKGPDESRLIELAKNLNVYDRCAFLGHQNNAIAIIRLFDVFVMSSYSEGFPLVVLEAGGVKVPILCIKSPLFLELFSNDDVVFYERNNLASMRVSLDKIFNRLNLYSDAIFHTTNTKYSCEIMAGNYMKLFSELNF